MPISLPATCYNWKATKGPERAYVHPYHQMLVDKIYLCTKPNPQTGAPLQVHLTFEQALERIRCVDHLTRGIPKIFYLVGWQYEGHDSKYPAWGEVNQNLKRPVDRNGAESLRWLMKTARQHHATVSVHINMQDAYENSPAWEGYRSNHLLLGKGGIWGGEQCYLVDYAREWESGYAQKRIDALVTMLQLREAGTVHIDAFAVNGPNPEVQLGAMRRIVRYWRNKGIDVTVEHLATRDPEQGLIGLTPMVWHINYDLWKRPNEHTEKEYMAIPASLFCGGEDHGWRSRLFGTSMIGEELNDKEAPGGVDAPAYLAEFCLKTLPWQYLNHFERQELYQDADLAILELGHGLTVRLDLRSQQTTIRQDEMVLRDGDDVFVPALWKQSPGQVYAWQKIHEIIAYSRNGYLSRKWQLPESWHEVKQLQVTEINSEGNGQVTTIPVEFGEIGLSLLPGQAVAINQVPHLAEVTDDNRP